MSIPRLTNDEETIPREEFDEMSIDERDQNLVPYKCSECGTRVSLTHGYLQYKHRFCNTCCVRHYN